MLMCLNCARGDSVLLRVEPERAEASMSEKGNLVQQNEIIVNYGALL